MSVVNVTDSYRCRSATLLVLGLLLCLDFAGRPETAFGSNSLVKPITQITIDDDGRDLHYPSTIFYDRDGEELFLINGGSSRVVVYGADFFPRTSIGAGRGVDAPRGVYVTGSGHVYITQSSTAANPSPRISILNGAFFIDREILLNTIPAAADWSPSKLAVSREGLIYLAGTSSRGVLVFDREGAFLRRLQPMDLIANQEAVAAAALQLTEGGKRPAEDDEMVDARGDIPEEFRPRGIQRGGEARSGPGLGPVSVFNVTIDSAGNLYLLSAETSKIYVYSADETFLFSFGEKGGTPRKMSQPRGLAIDERRRLIYVADYMRHTILVYDLNGRHLFEFGGRGTGQGWFNFPTDIAINRQGQVLVSDLFNRRVQVLEIEFVGAFPLFQGRRPASPADIGRLEEPLAENKQPAGLIESRIEETSVTE